MAAMYKRSAGRDCPNETVTGIMAILGKPAGHFVRSFGETVKGVEQIAEKNDMRNCGVGLENCHQLLDLFVNVGDDEGCLIHGRK
jgi:hypothetical protein